MRYLPENVIAENAGLFRKHGPSPLPGQFRPSGGGFTLIELLTTIVVLCILTAAAIPSFIGLIRSNRLTSESNALLNLLMLGRSEAAKRTQQVTLCKSRDGTVCSSASDVQWHDGIILFADSNADRILDADEPIIRSESPFGAADEIKLSAGHALTYRANGTSSSGTFTIKSGALQKKVIVSLAGRARIE